MIGRLDEVKFTDSLFAYIDDWQINESINEIMILIKCFLIFFLVDNRTGYNSGLVLLNYDFNMNSQLTIEFPEVTKIESCDAVLQCCCGKIQTAEIRENFGT